MKNTAPDFQHIDVEALYRRYGPMVLRRCRQLLKNEDLAADAMQETFVRVLRNRNTLNAKLPVQPAVPHCHECLPEHDAHQPPAADGERGSPAGRPGGPGVHGGQDPRLLRPRSRSSRGRKTARAGPRKCTTSRAAPWPRRQPRWTFPSRVCASGCARFAIRTSRSWRGRTARPDSARRRLNPRAQHLPGLQARSPIRWSRRQECCPRPVIPPMRWTRSRMLRSPRPPLFWACSRSESDPVVADLQPRFRLPELEKDLHRLRPGVLQRVVQRLLRDLVQLLAALTAQRSVPSTWNCTAMPPRDSTASSRVWIASARLPVSRAGGLSSKMSRRISRSASRAVVPSSRRCSAASMVLAAHPADGPRPRRTA